MKWIGSILLGISALTFFYSLRIQWCNWDDWVLAIIVRTWIAAPCFFIGGTILICSWLT